MPVSNAAKLKEAKAKFDQKVYDYILKAAPDTRAGDIEKHVVVPDIIWKSALGQYDGTLTKMMRSVDNSLKRLRAKGRIWFCKEGGPHWETQMEVDDA
jgi:hypothetical protein